MPLELKVPSLGESVTEVEIGEWLHKTGDHVDVDEPVVVLESDKASLEVPSPVRGVLGRILKERGARAEVGETIAVIDEAEAGARTSTPPPAGAPAPEPAPVPARGGRADAPAPATARDRKTEAPAPAAAEEAASPAPPAAPDQGPWAAPAARRLLREHGLAAGDVARAGRVGKEDVVRHLERERRDEEAVPMTSLRRRIAERLVQAQQTAALLTTFNEVDMSEVMALRRTFGEAFKERHGVKLGFMSFFVKALIEALKETPALNAEIRGTDVVYRRYFDIGIAVGSGRGLVVPVLRNADRMGFAALEKAIEDFGARAREGKLALEELQGGTFTISNGGIYGSLLSTPIVNPPQSGILGMHAIQERPVARGGQVVIRPMMYLALTYDHRIVDGREAVLCLRRIKEILEAPPRLFLEA